MPANHGLRIGIDLGGTKIEGIVLDDDGRQLARRRIATPVGDYPGTVAAIAALVAGLEGDSGHAGCVGVGIPGAVSLASGTIKNANSTWLIGRPLGGDLASALGRPVRLANDANCFTVSEAIDGAAAGASTVFGVILGTGVGGGLAIDGRIHGGRNAIAGEWGHNPLPWPADDERPGPPCYCGKSGCIETFLSGAGLSRAYYGSRGESGSESGGESDSGPREGAGKTAEQIAALAAKGDSRAKAALERYEQRLARALATVINIIDPEVVVLGGGLSNIERLYRNVPRLWEAWAFTDRLDTRLLRARHGDSSGVRGAAWLWPKEGNRA